MNKPFSIRARIRSFKYAITGIRKLIASEHNAWIHCGVVVIVTIAGFVFGITAYEWMMVILCFGLVLGAEALNTAIEKLVDLVSPEWKPKAGDIKDLASAGVLFCAIAAAIVGLIIFIPYIL